MNTDEFRNIIRDIESSWARQLSDSERQSYWDTLHSLPQEAVRAAVDSIKNEEGSTRPPLPVTIWRLARTYCPNTSWSAGQWEMRRRLLEQMLDRLEARPPFYRTAKVEREIRRCREILVADYPF